VKEDALAEGYIAHDIIPYLQWVKCTARAGHNRHSFVDNASRDRWLALRKQADLITDFDETPAGLAGYIETQPVTLERTQQEIAEFVTKWQNRQTQ
jgi:hypothetical protein